MSRKTFHQLLERYLTGNCTPEEQEIVNRWYDLLDGDKDFRDIEVNELEACLWDKINERTSLEKNGKKRSLFKVVYLKRYLAAAVAITLLLGASLWIKWRLECHPVKPDFTCSSSDDIVVVSNTHSKPKTIYLPDSTIVELYRGSTLSYPVKFKKTGREVNLEGNALFSVKANPENPFWVFHEGIITKVLGTRFLIKRGAENGLDEVIVYSGKVEVMRENKNKSILERIIAKPVGVSLTVNQRAILDERNNILSETLAEQPIPIETKRSLLNDVAFNEVSLSDLAERLSEVYGLNIEVRDQVRNITFTGDLSDMELFNQLDIVCKVTRTAYSIEGKTIIIQ